MGLKQINRMLYILIPLLLSFPLIAEESPVDSLIASFSKQMERELSLQCTGEGGKMQKKVELILLKFNAYRTANIAEARSLQLYVMEQLLEAINRDETLQPYLIEYPFTNRHVEISISFQGPYGYGPYANDSVAYVFNKSEYARSQNKNKIFYFSYDPFAEKNTELLNETFEEATSLAKILHLEFPYEHKTTDLNSITDRILTSYVQSLKDKRGLTCCGISGDLTPSKEEIGAVFTIRSRASQSEARELSLFATQKLLEAINPHLKAPPFPLNRIKIRIDFTDLRQNSYEDGSITSVILQENNLSYYHKVTISEKGVPEEYWNKPTVLLTSESYQEAVQAPKPNSRSFLGFFRALFH